MSSESLSEVHASVEVPHHKGVWRKILAFFGPAYMVSVGYMDPGNWATDLAGGSQFGYSLIWVLLMSNLIALLLQSLAARLGIVKGMDLAQASRSSFPPIVNIPLYMLAEIAIAACDLAEVIGMAIGLQLLFGLPLIVGVSITILDSLLLLFLMSKGIRLMEAFILSLIFIIGVSFLTEMIIVQPVFSEVMSGFQPTALSGSALYIAIGIIGATVMPHNLYLHSSLVQTRKIERSDSGIRQAIKFNFFDSVIALNLAFFVNAAILILAAAAFYKNGLFEVAEIQDAHQLLDHIFGKMAPALFAVALIAAGQSSTITGTLAGQIVMEGYLNLRIRPWLRRLLTRLIAIVPAFLTIIYFGEDKLGELLVLSQVVLSLQLGFAIIPLIHFTSDPENMGTFVIKPWLKVLAWISAAIIVVLNVKLAVQQLGSWLEAAGDSGVYIWLLVVPIYVLAGILLVYVTLHPWIKSKPVITHAVPHGEATIIKGLQPVQFRRIAVTIDFSANDQSSIEHALSQGGKEAEYLLVHIVETAGARYLGSFIKDLETNKDTENIQLYTKELEALGYRVSNEIGFGSPVDVIPQIVNAYKADCLVMGAHGHKGLKDLIFGATVDAVRHRVDVPVLVVKKRV